LGDRRRLARLGAPDGGAPLPGPARHPRPGSARAGHRRRPPGATAHRRPALAGAPRSSPHDATGAARRPSDVKGRNSMAHVSRRVLRAVPAALALALAPAFSGTAYAHARIGPGHVLKGDVQGFVLVVPGEKEGIATTGIRIGVPEGVRLRAAG